MPVVSIPMTQSGRGINMKTVNDEEINDVMSMGLHQASEFEITDADKFINLILDSSYKDPLTATAREICQNASEVDPNFSVHLPTELEPWFSCIDNGTGLSKPDLIRYASGLGASTKDRDNTQVGGFGIGMKVPFTMADQYNIISRYDGIKYTFTAYKDEYGKAQFVEMTAPVETDEPNGLDIKVPVRTFDIREFNNKFIKTLRYFDPKPNTNIEVEWDTPEYIMTGVGWGIRKKPKDSYREKSRIIMGNLWYPVDTSEIREEYNDIYAAALENGLDIRLPIGSIDLPLSREDIQYTPRTIKVIRDKVDKIVNEIRVTAQDVVSQSPDIWTATQFHHDNDILRKLKMSLRYQGKELQSSIEHHLPDGTGSFYTVDPFRFIRYKTLSLTDHRVPRRIQDKVRVPYQASVQWFVVDEKAKRKPSRLLSYMKDTFGENREDMPYAYVLVYPEGEKVKAEAWIKSIYKDADIIDFDAEVPDWAPLVRASVPKSQRRKLARVKIMVKRSGHLWGRADSWWKDGPSDFDVDENTGIWVATKSNEVHFDEGSFKYYSNNDFYHAVDRMKRYGLIPEDTPIYGCPANVKNKLKDHPNYLSLEEALALSKEIIRASVNPSLQSKLITARRVVDFLKQEDVPLDIDVKTGYYKQCSDYIDLLNRNKENMNLVDYLLSDTKSYRVDQRVEKIDTIIRDNFKADYPLLLRPTSYHRAEDFATDIAEYIKMKSHIIEQGVKL